MGEIIPVGSLRPIWTAHKTLGGRTLERPSCGGFVPRFLNSEKLSLDVFVVKVICVLVYAVACEVEWIIMVVRHRQTNKLPPALKHGVYSGMTLLPGEDLATYHDFLGRVYAAVKPVDIIDEIFIDDVACLEWEVLRWRRLKSSLMRMCDLRRLEAVFE